MGVNRCPQRPRAYRPLFGVISTDRRNTRVKSLCRRFELQGFPWSFVKLTCVGRLSIGLDLLAN